MTRIIVLSLAAFACLSWVPAAHAGCSDAPAPGVDWRNCNMNGLKLPKLFDLSASTLRGATFDRADLSDVNLAGIKGSRSRFREARLRGAQFDGALLDGAEFLRADLTGASFRDANLRAARFQRAILRDADFTGAQIRNVKFDRADLSGATWIDGRTCADGSTGQCRVTAATAGGG